MRKQIVTPRHLDNLPVVRVVYIPQDIHTIAIQVTRETMGAMSIEFGVEIMTSYPNHRWLPALLQRLNRKGDPGFIERALNPGEWLVVLDEEVHVFPDDTFSSTFANDEAPAHEQFIGIVERRELMEDIGVPVENKTTFMDLGSGYTNEGEQELPELPPAG